MIVFAIIAFSIVTAFGFYIRANRIEDKLDAIEKRITKHGIPKNNTRKKK